METSEIQGKKKYYKESIIHVIKDPEGKEGEEMGQE